MRLSAGKKVTLIIILILILDQAVKLWIKTHMYLGQSESVFGDWFQIAYTENTGFAFGWSLGGIWGKLMLSLFRIIFIAILCVFLSRLIKRKMPMGVLVGIGMLIAGAAGNIFDSCFYGLIFDSGTTISPSTGNGVVWGKSSKVKELEQTESAPAESIAQPLPKQTLPLQTLPKTTTVQRPASPNVSVSPSVTIPNVTKEKFLLKSGRRNGSTDLVETLLEVTGDVKVPNETQEAEKDKVNWPPKLISHSPAFNLLAHGRKNTGAV